MSTYERGERDGAKFKVGDLVEKASGYRYPGVVRSVYAKGDGELRYDVEADHPDFAGMLHIFSEAQLVPRRPLPAAQPDPRDEALRLAREALVDYQRAGFCYGDAALAAIDALKE